MNHYFAVLNFYKFTYLYGEKSEKKPLRADKIYFS